MEIVLFVLGALIIFAILSWYCGYDSTERFDSPEWERREHWQGFSSN